MELEQRVGRQPTRVEVVCEAVSGPVTVASLPVWYLSAEETERLLKQGRLSLETEPDVCFNECPCGLGHGRDGASEAR